MRMRRLSVTMVDAERARTRMWKLYAHGHSKSSLPPTSARSLNGRVSMHEINATLTKDQWLRASPSGTKVTTTSTSITYITYTFHYNHHNYPTLLHQTSVAETIQLQFISDKLYNEHRRCSLVHLFTCSLALHIYLPR